MPRRGGKLARASFDACVVGLHCLHSDTAVAALTAANNRAAGRAVAYMVADDLMTKEAIEAAVQALGDKGADPNLWDWAKWLEKEKGIGIIDLYLPYFVPLSHFFVHTNAFTLTRHVRPGGKLRRRPAHPWARRSAVRLADGCAAVMADAIARERGLPDKAFIRYASAHISRLLTPGFTVAISALRSKTRWRDVPGMIRDLRALRCYINGPGRSDSADEQEAHVRHGIAQIFHSLAGGDTAAEMFTIATDELVARIVAMMNSNHEPENARTTAASSEPGTADSTGATV